MNPFSYGTVVKEPYFFDRKTETERIVNVLGGGNNLVLYAPRRFGKTSLVMRALQQLESRGFTCIYFDFMKVYSRESFIESADVMHLDALPEEETIAFLIDRFSHSNIFLDPRTAAVLIEKAGYIPYYIQFLASEIWQEAVNSQKEVSRDIIDFCANKILDRKNNFYFELFDRQTAYQKKLLKALVISGQSVFSNEYSHRFRLSAASTTQKALAGLVYNGIIEKHRQIYNFTDPFFSWFVSRYA